MFLGWFLVSQNQLRLQGGGGGVSWVLAVAADGTGIVSFGGLYVLH